MERLTEREVAAIALTGLLQARDTLCLRLACATGVIATCELTPLLDESALSDERLLALTLGFVKLIGSEADPDHVGAAFQVSPERARKALDLIAGFAAEALDSDSPIYAAVVSRALEHDKQPPHPMGVLSEFDATEDLPKEAQ